MSATAIINARVYTVDSEFQQYHNGAVVFENGLITEVGETGVVTIPDGANVVDGKGRTAVLPGFIDVHSHSSLLKGFSEGAQLMDWLPEYQREHQVLTPNDAYYACLLSYAEALKGGTTTVVDMYRFLHKGAAAARALGIRVHLVPYSADHPTKKFFETLEANEELIISQHESGHNRQVTVWIGLEHITYCSEKMFRKACDLAEKYEVRIHTHTSEQQEEVAKVIELFGNRPIVKFNDWGILRKGTVLAHCVWIDETELNILAETETGVAHCPISNMKLASGPAQLLEMQRAGLNVGLGTDGSISNNSLSMWECMKVGSLLQMVSRLDATAVSAAEAISLATIGGARLLGVEETLGSIEVGKVADLIAIDLWQPHLMPITPSEGHDPVLWNLVFAGRASDVTDVWIDGQHVVQNRSLALVDEKSMLEEIHDTTIDLLDRRENAPAIPMVVSS